MNEKFPIDSYVVYGKTGVCRVAERQYMTFTDTPEEYYVLSPNGDPRSCVYVPCQNEKLVSRMRPLLTAQEIDSCLEEADRQPLEWIDEKAERQIVFREHLADSDPGRLLRLIRCIYGKRLEKQAEGKRLSSMDEALLQDAIRLLEEEFAQSLGLTRPEVVEYIRQRLEK